MEADDDSLAETNSINYLSMMSLVRPPGLVGEDACVQTGDHPEGGEGGGAQHQAAQLAGEGRGGQPVGVQQVPRPPETGDGHYHTWTRRNIINCQRKSASQVAATLASTW